MPDVYVGLGSNVDPEAHLRLAVQSLHGRFAELRCSDVFRSPSFGFRGEDFLNMVVGFSTEAGADDVEKILSEIEYAGGRTREAARYVSRTLDLDLLLYGAMVRAGLRLPREDVLRYPFVLGPLADLAPGLVHPVAGVTLGAAWRRMASAPVALERLGPLSLPA